MNSIEAKKILSAHRPGREPARDAEVIAALEQTERDPALQQWWQQQQAFHVAMKHGFGQMPIPGDLRDRIRARAKIVAFPWWGRPTVWAAAAAIILFVGITALRWNPPVGNGSFATFRSRMVRAVLTQYRMDIQTNDMAAIRQFLTTNNAPANYTLPPKLMQLPPIGAGILSWQASRVSMVCLDSRVQGTLFLFITDQSEVKDPPTAARDYVQENKLMTVSWKEGSKVYVLAGQGTRETLAQYF